MNGYSKASICLCLAAGSLLSLASVGKGEAGEVAQEKVFAGRTAYLDNDIEGFRRLMVVGTLGGKGTLLLDQNTCSLNLFGDSEGCTRIAPVERTVSVKALKISDPTRAGRRLFEIEGTGLRNRLFLVVSPGKTHAHRLVYVDSGTKAPRPITLEPLAWEEPPAKARMSPATVNYSAIQESGMVVVFASGSHPTTGYNVRFEELPIDIYPPEYRLVQDSPSGPVLNVLMPFSIHIAFKAPDKVDRVVIHDSNGRHEVSVEQRTTEAGSDGQVRIEISGKLTAYRKVMFGHTAATVRAGGADFWLDGSKAPESAKALIASLDGKSVLVKGTLEYRRYGGDGSKPFLVFTSLEVTKAK